MKFQEYKTHLTKLLKSKENLLDTEGEVLIDRVIKLAQKYDNDLLQLLWNDEETKNKFFEQLDGISVFKERDFCFYVEERKLGNTYTNYENRIGLSTGRYKLSDIDDVVINFPYKDCILEGGQSTEEGLDTYFELDAKSNDYVEKKSKRKEIFFNQILAKNELDRLKEPKAFVNVKKYSQKGEEKTTSFNRNVEGCITDNLIVKGNNLLAMHSLLKEFREQVKLIYIDPPYNTGSDSFKYNDNFNHSTWLTFMKNRLEIAKNFLTDDGFIVVQCDDNEQAYLKVLMDEVFDHKHVSTICVQMSYASGEKMAHIDKKPPKIKEFLHIYTITSGTLIKPQYTSCGVDMEYNKYINKHNSEDSEDWEVLGLNSVFRKLKINDEEQKEEFMLKNASIIFNRVRNKADVFKSTLGNKKLSKIITATGLHKWAWNGREVVFLSDRIIEDYWGNETYAQALGDIWNDIPIVNLYLEGGVSLLRGKKPELLLSRIIDMLTEKNDLVLAFHLGSGTTAAVAHKMGRQYIGIEQLDYGDNDSVVRLNNVICGDKTGVSEAFGWQGGGEFIYLELAEFNQEAVSTILKAKTIDELQSFFEEMVDKFFLDYNVRVHEFKAVIMHEENFKNLSLDRQKEIFIKMLDLNQLYVNVSDMEDSEYNLTANDIKLTKDFYRLNDN